MKTTLHNFVLFFLIFLGFQAQAQQKFLNVRLTQAKILTIASPAINSSVYCSDCPVANFYIYNGSSWIGIDAFKTPLGFLPTNSVLSSTGRIWMDRNLGASQVATSSTDAASYGDMYQWGRAADGHQLRTSVTTGTTVTSASPGHALFITADSGTGYNWTSFAGEDNLWQGVSGINNPCPSGYRIPTEIELEAERATFSSNNATGAFASVLKLPAAGYRTRITGTLNNVGSSGYYWSSSVNVAYTRDLIFNGSDALFSNYGRANGMSVRCIMD
jgi:uncharacterized protein (TIGR02145 family)